MPHTLQQYWCHHEQKSQEKAGLTPWNLFQGQAALREDSTVRDGPWMRPAPGTSRSVHLSVPNILRSYKEQSSVFYQLSSANVIGIRLTRLPSRLLHCQYCQSCQ